MVVEIRKKAGGQQIKLAAGIFLLLWMGILFIKTNVSDGALSLSDIVVSSLIRAICVFAGDGDLEPYIIAINMIAIPQKGGLTVEIFKA